MRVVVAGASGFIGRRVVPRLRERGHEVVCGSRSPDGRPGGPWVALDVDADGGLDDALRGADALVYLVHGLGVHGHGLLEREIAAATRVRDAVDRAGCPRVVYLGGPAPRGERSEHLEARVRTGEILRSGRASTLELRASMIIGEGSQSWLICRDLAFRLPVMILPRWTASQSVPIGVDDVIDALVDAVEWPQVPSVAYDLPGPEPLTARQILERVAAQRGMAARMVPVPFLSPRLSSHWLRFVTRADITLARQLIDGLTNDLLPDGRSFWDERPGRAPTPFDEAVRRALAEEVPPGAVGRALEGVIRRLARG
jgi:uncharacterized protein YbjT (DUF2867 family)